VVEGCDELVSWIVPAVEASIAAASRHGDRPE
jgi:hypothetical protein